MILMPVHIFCDALPPSLSRLKAFFRDSRQGDWNAELSRYISFALTSGPPPSFKPKYDPAQMPPDVLALEPVRPMLAEFWEFDRALIHEKYAAIVGRLE